MTLEACFHEAGHAVIADRLGVRVRGVHVFSDGTGRCDLGDPDAGPSLFRAKAATVAAFDLWTSDQRSVVIYLAGPCAEMAFTGVFDLPHARLDLDHAEHHARSHKRWNPDEVEAFLGEMWSATCRLVERHWPQVEALAQALMAEGSVDEEGLAGVPHPFLGQPIETAPRRR